jgi:hypothetical protein
MDADSALSRDSGGGPIALVAGIARSGKGIGTRSNRETDKMLHLRSSVALCDTTLLGDLSIGQRGGKRQA